MSAASPADLVPPATPQGGKSGKSGQPRPPKSKQARLVALLRRRRGASLAELVEVTGWQAHSVRGAISGTLKKKLGLTITAEKVAGRGRVYRLAAAA